MATIGSYALKTHLAALLRRVEAGEALTITRHGLPVARIVPIEEPVRLTPIEARHAAQCLGHPVDDSRHRNLFLKLLIFVYGEARQRTHPGLPLKSGEG